MTETLHMPLAVSQIAVNRYLEHTPGATPEDIERWKRTGEIVVVDEITQENER